MKTPATHPLTGLACTRQALPLERKSTRQKWPMWKWDGEREPPLGGETRDALWNGKEAG